MEIQNFPKGIFNYRCHELYVTGANTSSAYHCTWHHFRFNIAHRKASEKVTSLFITPLHPACSKTGYLKFVHKLLRSGRRCQARWEPVWEAWENYGHSRGFLRAASPRGIAGPEVAYPLRPRPHAPATMSKQQATLSKLRSTLSKQHSTLLPQTATTSNDSIVKFRPFDKVETKWKCSICFDFVERTKFRSGNNVAKNGNNVEATYIVEKIVKLVAFDNVASTLLLVWTGLPCRRPWSLPSTHRVRKPRCDLCLWLCPSRRGIFQDETAVASANHRDPCVHRTGSPTPALQCHNTTA